MNAAEKVKALLNALNLSISEVAARMGTTRQNLSYKIKEERLTTKDLEAIAAACGVEVQITFIVPARVV